MNPPNESPPAASPGRAAALAATALGCFHLAHAHPWLAPLMFGYLICLHELSRLLSPRAAFYSGLAIGLGLFAPQLLFLVTIFNAAALPLWLSLALWIGLFLLLASHCHRNLSPWAAAIVVPFLWLGLEYFRSELYFLRFTWFTAGFAFSGTSLWSRLGWLGVYGIGYLLMLLITLTARLRPAAGFRWWAAIGAVLGLLALLPEGAAVSSAKRPPSPRFAGVQLEFPSEPEVRLALGDLVRRNPGFDIAVLSEYTFDGPIPLRIRDWCRQNGKYLIAGGKDLHPDGTFHNTAFVIGPDGRIDFQQAKSVPIQFFNDGLPAPSRKLWASPWGRFGLCVCYDLNYRWVIDDLVRQGAQGIIVPTMDVIEWGARQHELHSRVAPLRAAETGVPIFRLCSSGVSQAVDARGHVAASAPFPGPGESIFATFNPVSSGRTPLDHWLAPAASAFSLFFLAHVLVLHPVLQRRRLIVN